MTLSLCEDFSMLRRTFFIAFALAVCLAVLRISGPTQAAPQPKAPAKDDDKALELKIEGQLAENDPVDPVLKMPCKVHTMKLPKGRTVQIDLTSTDFDAYLRVLDSNDKELARDDDSGGGLDARIIFAIPKDDTYKIVATTFDGEVGNYQLLVKPVAQAAQAKPIKTKAPELGKSVSIEDKLTNADPKDAKVAGPAKIYEIELAAGIDYQFDLVSTDFDSFLRVLDKDAEELAFDDDSGGNLNAQLVFTPPAAGKYYIVAASLRAGGAGDYTLSIEAKKHVEVPAIKTKAPEAGKTIALADKLTNDDLKDKRMRGPSKIYEVELAANAFQIDLVSNDFDSFLRVLDKNGKELASDDDSGGGLNARLTFTPPAAGTYRIVATSLGAGTGAFTLSIENKK
jgi:hypothetical protein